MSHRPPANQLTQLRLTEDSINVVVFSDTVTVTVVLSPELAVAAAGTIVAVGAVLSTTMLYVAELDDSNAFAVARAVIA